jgi:hypothetical protein
MGMCGDLFMRDRRSRLRRTDEETQGLTKRVDQGILRLTLAGRPEQARIPSTQILFVAHLLICSCVLEVIMSVVLSSYVHVLRARRFVRNPLKNI